MVLTPFSLSHRCTILAMNSGAPCSWMAFCNHAGTSPDFNDRSAQSTWHSPCVFVQDRQHPQRTAIAPSHRPRSSPSTTLRSPDIGNVARQRRVPRAFSLTALPSPLGAPAIAQRRARQLQELSGFSLRTQPVFNGCLHQRPATPPASASVPGSPAPTL